MASNLKYESRLSNALNASAGLGCLYWNPSDLSPRLIRSEVESVPHKNSVLVVG